MRCRAHRRLTNPVEGTIMQDSWQIVRVNDRQLALCLLFAPSADRQLLADIFCLANELENAIRIPSEIMLAAIRLQWWHDALTDMTAPAEVPLMRTLQAHIAAERISRDELLALVALWHTRITDSEASATPVLLAVAACAKVTCGADFTAIAEKLPINPAGTRPKCQKSRGLTLPLCSVVVAWRAGSISRDVWQSGTQKPKNRARIHF